MDVPINVSLYIYTYIYVHVYKYICIPAPDRPYTHEVPALYILSIISNIICTNYNKDYVFYMMLYSYE